MKKKICIALILFFLLGTSASSMPVMAGLEEPEEIVEQNEDLNGMNEEVDEEVEEQNNIKEEQEQLMTEEGAETEQVDAVLPERQEMESDESTNILKVEESLQQKSTGDEIPEVDSDIKNEFVSDENGIKYYDADGQEVVGEVRINGFLYCFDENGYLKLGLQEHSNGKSLYTNIEPYLSINEFQNMSDGTRYFDENGLMVNGCEKINSNWYYFKENGLMHQGWRTVESQRFYYYPDGKLARGVVKISGSWYYFKGDGNMHKGWRTVGTQKFYYHSDGKLAQGVAKISGSWYYFKGDGNMHKGWRTVGTQKFYYHSDGKLVRGVAKISGSWYYFKGDGNMHKGWRTVGTQKFYYHSDGKLVRGVAKISGNWYYFKGDGSMYKGWRTVGSQKFYYDSSGKLQIGSKVIGGKRYFFNRDGSLAEDSQMCTKAQQYSSKTKWLILVDTKKNRVSVFNGSKGKWDQKKYWKCTSGASRTPTVKGQFTVGIKGKVFGKGYSCWYYTQFYGDYLFHSILYNPGSMTSVQDGRLGINASHGCVRLSLSNAKWIYNNIPKGTKVVTY